MNQVRAWIAAIAVCAIGACHDSEVDQLTRAKLAVCACQDVKCAEAALGDVPTGDVKSNRRTQAIARAMLDCLAKLYAAQKPDTDPDNGSDDPGTGSG